MEPTVEDLYRIIRQKTEREALLLKKIKIYESGKGVSYAWGLLSALGKQFVRCPKCGSETKPETNSKTGFIYMRCIVCGESLQTKKKKKVFNAYASELHKIR